MIMLMESDSLPDLYQVRKKGFMGNILEVNNDKTRI